MFLVALGIDYNIFLMARVREETLQHGTRDGMVRGLAVTGGVITSAGIVLAGTFSVLAVLPLVFLTEIGFVIAFGVLLDTFLVRSVLVPALVLEIGRSGVVAVGARRRRRAAPGTGGRRRAGAGRGIVSRGGVVLCVVAAAVLLCPGGAQAGDATTIGRCFSSAQPLTVSGTAFTANAPVAIAGDVTGVGPGRRDRHLLDDRDGADGGRARAALGDDDPRRPDQPGEHRDDARPRRARGVRLEPAARRASDAS